MRDLLQRQNLGFIVRSLRGLGYASIALWLTACSDTPSALAPLADYQQRVANTLQREAITYQPAAYPRLPDVRTLRTKVPRISVSLLDSWRLDQCAAGQLIAQRNSALGKLEQGISRYFSDLQLTHALQTCVTELEQANAAQLATRLRKAMHAKQQTLAASQQLAIATDDALRHTLRVAPQTLASADDAAFASNIAALDRVLGVLAEAHIQPSIVSTEQKEQLEQALEQLHQSDYLPRLWRTLHTLSAYLQQLNPLVTDVATAAGCASKGRPQRAEVLHTVFLKYFIQHVQPQLAGFTRQGYVVNERLQHLTALNTHPELDAYLQQLLQLTERLNRESKRHVEPWQTFFKACQYQPG